MSGTYPGPRGRKKAIELKAQDARELLKLSIPFILRAMTPEQVGKVQKVLDAAVVNPAIEKEVAELMRRSVIAQSGELVSRDPKLVHQANALASERIAFSNSDKRIRLDHAKLLAPKTFLPTTDNPDELAYLAKVRNTLAQKGIWLRFDYKMVRDPSDPSRWIIDPRSFEVWISLGSDGDTIPVPSGPLTREALLSTTLLGANYYREVAQGSIQRNLENAIKSIKNEVFTGETWHEMQQQARDEATRGVVLISDGLGGADFPSLKIWNAAHQLLLQALKENVGGNVREASTTALYAAFAAKAAAQTLSEYVQKTTKGAQRALTILTVASTLGKIAGSFLVVRSLVVGLIRIAAAEGSAAAATSAATNVAKNRSPAAFYQTNYRGVASFERTINQFATPHTGSGFGTVVRRYDLATQQKISGWIQDFETAAAQLVRNGGQSGGGGWVVSREEFVRIAQTCDKKWGDIMHLFSDLDRMAMGL
jgi:hypothetical protein